MSRTPTALRQRRAVVVLAGDGRTNDHAVRALTDSLAVAGVETHYLGREPDAVRIATAAVALGADAVEVCVTGTGCLALLRDLLRELNLRDRCGTSVVVHRLQ